jgi:microcin C transport system ATP-binding protein
MNGFIIATNRLYLKPFCEEDLKNLHQLHSNPQIAATTIDGIQTFDQTKKVLLEFINHQNQNGFSQWAVYEKHMDNFIGRAGLTKRTLCQETGEQIEIRYALLPEFWGKGYASELAMAIKEFAFEKLKLAKIVASTKIDNEKSKIILKKCGFEYIKNIIPQGYGKTEEITYWECVNSSPNIISEIAAPILKVNNLTVNFGSKNILNNISFTLQSKKITALVGQSGSGKSTVALGILKLLNNAKIGGEVLFENQDLLELNENSLCKIRGKEIGMIFQDPLTSLNPLHTIYKQISEAISIHNKLSKKEINARILELLELVNLKNFSMRLDSYPHQLSGGQKQRVMIAIALANNPKILIADEPTTSLDVITQNEILKLLLELRKTLNLSILFITHNLRIVKKLADEVLVMNGGQIIESGIIEEVFSNPKSNYTRLLISSLDCRLNEYKALDNTKLLEVKNLNVKFAIKNNFFGIKNKYFYANKNISFDLNRGETLGVIGESGSGKSTLIMAIVNLVKKEGKVIFEGKNKFDKKEIQVIFQDPYSSLNPRMTVKSIIEEGLIIHKIGENKAAREKMIDDILQEIDLTADAKERYPHQFSGGQRQRIAIARSLILKPKLLILDEPTSALDLITQNEILNLLKNLQKIHQISYIFISHDLDIVKSLAHKIAVIKDGEIIEQGSTAQLINSPQSEYSKKLIELFN